MPYFVMNQLRQVNLGDVLWLKTPQTLAPLHRAQDLSDKVRPFIVLSSAEIRTDHNSIATQDRPLLGVNCTSQDFLVEGRPHISFTLQGQSKTTYALLDSIRNVGTIQQSMVCHDRLSSSEQETLLEKLDEIIRPEKRFYLRDFVNFKKPIMPGQIHRIKTIDTDGPRTCVVKTWKICR